MFHDCDGAAPAQGADATLRGSDGAVGAGNTDTLNLTRSVRLGCFRDTAQTGQIDDCQRTIADLKQAVAAEFRQYVADVNDGQAGRIGDMMLAQRKIHRFILDHAADAQAFRQIQDQTGNTFRSAAAAEIDGQPVGAAAFFAPSTRHDREQIGLLPEGLLDESAWEHAVANVCDRLDCALARCVKDERRRYQISGQ